MPLENHFCESNNLYGNCCARVKIAWMLSYSVNLPRYSYLVSGRGKKCGWEQVCAKHRSPFSTTIHFYNKQIAITWPLWVGVWEFLPKPTSSSSIAQFQAKSKQCWKIRCASFCVARAATKLFSHHLHSNLQSFKDCSLQLISWSESQLANFGFFRNFWNPTITDLVTPVRFEADLS